MQSARLSRPNAYGYGQASGDERVRRRTGISGYKSEKDVKAKGGKLFEHYCDAKGCKAWGTFGYITRLDGLYFCREHQQEGEDALIGRHDYMP